MSETKYDYGSYEKTLERILSLSETDYWTQYVDINRHQVNVAKTYLWVSVALLGGYFSVINRYSEYISNDTFSMVFTFIGVFSAIFAFGLCLYALPARQGYKAIPNESWGDFSLLAHNLLQNKESNIYITVLTDLVDKVDIATYHNLSTNRKRALLLRKTSWVLIASFVFAIFAVATSTVSISFNKHEQIERVTMTDNNEPTDTGTDNKKEESSPNVPTPAGPLTGNDIIDSVIATEDSKPDATIIKRFTESKDK